MIKKLYTKDEIDSKGKKKKNKKRRGTIMDEKQENLINRDKEDGESSDRDTYDMTT